MRAFTLATLLTLFAGAARADVYYLQDGDRISGRTLSQVAGQYRVQTAYGRVTIPKGQITKIVRDDGSEEVVQAAAPTPSAAPTPAPAAAIHLVCVVTGASFWQAWSPAKDAATPDPTLRLAITADEELLAVYSDAQPDPDIPGALVNAFSFDPGHVKISAGEGVEALPPETQPGRISLRLELPARFAGDRRLRIAYQVNDGSAETPAWHDLVESAIHAELKTDATQVMRIHQDRGRMEFSGFGRKKMKNVETFRIEMGME